MNFDKSGIALIVGGSSGMGLETAKLLLENDVEVVIVGNNENKLEKALEELKKIGSASAIQANLFEKAGVQKVAFDRSGFKYHGRIKALADAAREHGMEF